MLGSTLRQARESKELPLREVEWATRIKADYLQALEREDFAALPAPVYARGFLRTYANYLGIDPEPLIAEYNQLNPAAAQIISTRPAVRRDPPKLAITPALLAGVFLGLLALAFIGYVGRQIILFTKTGAVASQASPSPFVDLSPAPTPSARPTPLPSAKVYTGVEVVVRLDGPVWLRVEVDGKVSDQTTAAGKVFPAGTTLTFSGTQTVHVRSGKAGHTFVTVNGADQGAMPGDSAGVGDKTYQKQ
ncbi:MAG TPA: RodZ domain-containing protein [Candidatus Dormibacteraeota bacterium]|jgi:cytoskeletal protein RodZ|nr:RodZ domain-containing protein [Candidatus Dormibacteraeota bacterium]